MWVRSFLATIFNFSRKSLTQSDSIFSKPNQMTFCNLQQSKKLVWPYWQRRHYLTPSAWELSFWQEILLSYIQLSKGFRNCDLLSDRVQRNEYFRGVAGASLEIWSRSGAPWAEERKVQKPPRNLGSHNRDPSLNNEIRNFHTLRLSQRRLYRKGFLNLKYAR